MTPIELLRPHQITVESIVGAEPGKPDPLDGIIVQSSSPFKRFAEKVDIWYPIPTYVNADDTCRALTGYYMPIGNQEFGPCCTAYSTSDAIKLATCQAISRGPNKPTKKIAVPSNFCIPHLYSISRCYTYGGKVVPLRVVKEKDGSSQFANVLAAKEIGVVECKKYPWGDVTYYDAQLCTSFISPTRPKPWPVFGPPVESMTDCKKIPLDVFQVYTEREAMSALAHGFVLLFSSDWYFYQTDSEGTIVAHMITNGGHAMSIFGYIQENGKNKLAVRNQMGSKIFYGKNHPKFPVRGTGLTDFNSLKWSFDLKAKYVDIIAIGKLDLVNSAAIRK